MLKYLKKIVQILMDVQLPVHFMYRTNGQIMDRYKVYTLMVMKWLHIQFRKF